MIRMMKYTFYWNGTYYYVYATTYESACLTFDHEYGHAALDAALCTQVQAS